MTYPILREFRPKPEKESQFRTVYRCRGVWARFFHTSPGLLGTQLFRDSKDLHRFVMLDRWLSREAFEKFRLANLSESQDLDICCESFTSRELPRGSYETVEA
jgi:heme-degrading monooxygenase HmoA